MNPSSLLGSTRDMNGVPMAGDSNVGAKEPKSNFGKTKTASTKFVLYVKRMYNGGRAMMSLQLRRGAEDIAELFTRGAVE